jgi:hypothetical protein
MHFASSAEQPHPNPSRSGVQHCYGPRSKSRAIAKSNDPSAGVFSARYRTLWPGRLLHDSRWLFGLSDISKQSEPLAGRARFTSEAA